MCKDTIDLTVDPSDPADIVMVAMTSALLRAVAREDITGESVSRIFDEAAELVQALENGVNGQSMLMSINNDDMNIRTQEVVDAEG